MHLDCCLDCCCWWFCCLHNAGFQDVLIFLVVFLLRCSTPALVSDSISTCGEKIWSIPENCKVKDNRLKTLDHQMHLCRTLLDTRRSTLHEYCILNSLPWQHGRDEVSTSFWSSFSTSMAAGMLSEIHI
jgi:hypothetical protein